MLELLDGTDVLVFVVDGFIGYFVAVTAVGKSTVLTWKARTVNFLL